MKVEIKGQRPLKGEIFVPADKSISHRAVIIGAMARGLSVVKNLLLSADVEATIRSVKAFGVELEEGGILKIHGPGWHHFREPENVVDCGNSGTTMRLVAGVAALGPFVTVLTGDASLRRRPMRRVIEPLRLMGAEMMGRGGDNLAPLIIKGGRLKGIDYEIPVPSAQIKSALLLAGSGADGITRIKEPLKSRDHTERMLLKAGARIKTGPDWVEIEGGKDLEPQEWVIPGDISSAAFFLVAATVVEGSEVLLRDVGINPTRTGIIDVLQAMGGRVKILNCRDLSGEPVADLEVSHSFLQPVKITKEMIPSIIDEIPVLAVAMALAHGTSEVEGAAELRVKETDRIKMVVSQLGRLGVMVEERKDGFVIHGTGRIPGGNEVFSGGDHRMAMALAVAGLAADSPIIVDGFSCVDVSYPRFLQDLRSLQAY